MGDDFQDGDRPDGEPRTGECAVCHRRLDRSRLRPIAELNPGMAERIRRDLPPVDGACLICDEDRARYRGLYLEQLLEGERGELTPLDREVLDSFASGTTVAKDVDTAFEERRSLGERAADAVASFGGSWVFIGLFAMVLSVWMLFNAVTGDWKFDPYPFILLNLVLSCLAAGQAPIIMMSQRRSEAKDRLRAENDYKVNLKAELEIRHLHEKIDHHVDRQWRRLVEMQRLQIDILEETARENREGRARGERPGTSGG